MVSDPSPSARWAHLFAFLVFLCTAANATLPQMAGLGIPAYWQPVFAAILTALIVVFTFAANNVASLFTTPVGSDSWWAHVVSFVNGLLGVLSSVLPHALPGLQPGVVAGLGAAVGLISGVLTYVANWLDPAGTAAVSLRARQGRRQGRVA